MAARINDIYYESFQEAYNSAEENDEIILLTDIEQAITNNKTITLNLDNHTINGSITNNAQGQLAILNGEIKTTNTHITNNGTIYLGGKTGNETGIIEIANGTITNSGMMIINNANISTISSSTNSTNTIKNTGTLIMNYGRISTQTENVSYVYSIETSGGTFIMNGGHIKTNVISNSSGVFPIYSWNIKSLIMINGGLVECSGATYSSVIYNSMNNSKYVLLNGGIIKNNTISSYKIVYGYLDFKGGTIIMNNPSSEVFATNYKIPENKQLNIVVDENNNKVITLIDK